MKFSRHLYFQCFSDTLTFLTFKDTGMLLLDFVQGITHMNLLIIIAHPKTYY